MSDEHEDNESVTSTRYQEILNAYTTLLGTKVIKWSTHDYPVRDGVSLRCILLEYECRHNKAHKHWAPLILLGQFNSLGQAKGEGIQAARLIADVSNLLHNTDGGRRPRRLRQHQ